MFKNKNLLVVAVIAIVNALGYGIIIPVLYTYSQKYGLSDFQNGLLFSLFSVCQFIAAPVIGRMSDKYGRKPMLIISIAGTGLSFLMMAFAPSAIWLFIARALDGITAGNIPVASAVVSDSTGPEDRAKGFGIIGASFGFGFIFGPALAAFTLPFGDSVPFIVASIVSFIAVFMTYVLLPETNKHLGEVKKGKLFDFIHLFKSVFDEAVGLTLLLTLLYSLAFSLFIYAFQPFSVKVLGLSAREISIIFTIIGIVGVIAQAAIIPKFTKKYGEKKNLSMSLSLMIFTFFSFFLARSFIFLIAVTIVNSLANAFVMPMVQSLLSKEVDLKSQGSIQGLNASYMSLGFIIGPIIGGLLATIYLQLPFLIGSVTMFLCFLLSQKILSKPHPVQHTF